jgi:hypothetical protein
MPPDATTVERSEAGLRAPDFTSPDTLRADRARIGVV